MEHRQAALVPVIAPLLAGLIVLVTLLGLIGFAIRDPKPHDIPVGVVGPPPAVQQLTDGLNSKAPGAFQFTSYLSEDDARAGLDSNAVDAVLVIGGGPPRLIVAAANGDTVSGVITGVFTAAFAAQGAQLLVETVHPFPSGDSHGVILFFVVLATIISTFVAQVVLFVRGRSARLATWIGVTAAWAVIGAVAAVGMNYWLVGGYDRYSASAMAGLLALTSFAVGSATAGLTRLLGAPGIGLAGLVVVLLDLVSSGGPVGSNVLPDAYRALAPWMPVAQAGIALRSALYFDGSAATRPVLVLTGWLIGGLVVLLIAGAVRRPAATA